MKNIVLFYRILRGMSARFVMLFTLLIYISTASAEPNYFYFECTEGSVKIELKKNKTAPIVSLQYSFDGQNWTSYLNSITITSGQKLYLMANDDGNCSFANSTINYNYFSTTFTKVGKINVGGNIAYLLNKDANISSLNQGYIFNSLFYNCSAIVDASNLLIPFEKLSEYCYFRMFSGCTNLKSAPKILPAKKMTDYCYYHMFSGCSNLENAPQLPATSLAKWCYGYMFDGCKSLTKAPELPALELVDDCYNSVFYNCSSLNYINASFLTTPSNSYTSNWTIGCHENGVFVQNPKANWKITINSGLTVKYGFPYGWTVASNDAFDGGDGTSHAPFLIGNKQQMANLLNLLSGRASFNSFTDLLSLGVTQFTGDTNFKLTADLDYSNGLSYYSENGTIGAKYLPGIIDTNVDPSTGGVFTGVFDGDNHTIAGIKGCHFYKITDVLFADGKGLFYDVNGATIKNLAVVNSYNIFGTTSLSGNVTFENCYFSFDPQKTRYKSSTDSYTAIGTTDNTYSSNVTLTNSYCADYATKSSANEQGTVTYSSNPLTSNPELWQKDDVSMQDKYILKSMAVILTGDDGHTYVTDKLMLQPRTNTMMKAKEEDKCGLEFKYNVYTVDAEQNVATIQNLYLNDYSIINTNGWVSSKFGNDDDDAILSTNLIFNNTYNNVQLKAVHHERVVNVTANGILTKEQPVTSTNSWMSFCLPYSVSKMYGYYFKGVKDNSNSLCFAKLKSTEEHTQPADAFMVNAKDLVYTNDVVDYIHVNGRVSDNIFIVSASRIANGEDIPFTINDRSSSEANFVGVFKTETGANLYPQNLNIFTYKISSSGVINKTTNTSWIYPFRTYLRVDPSDESLFTAVGNSKSASSMFFEEDEVTAVREVKFSGNSFDCHERSVSSNEDFYTVSGMKIGNDNTSLKPGVYLNGRGKVVIR